MRRLLPIVLGVALVIGGVYGLLVVFSGRDEGDVERPAASGLGTLEPERRGPPPQSGGPPTSGAHERRSVTGEGQLGTDELLTALETGNVVLVHPGARAPAALRRLQGDVSGPFDAGLAAAGQMVVLTRWAGVDGVEALAWRRRLRAASPDDPRLRAFAEAWLGQGRGRTG